jgi:hypothetical protein
MSPRPFKNAMKWPYIPVFATMAPAAKSCVPNLNRQQLLKEAADLSSPVDEVNL